MYKFYYLFFVIILSSCAFQPTGSTLQGGYVEPTEKVEGFATVVIYRHEKLLGAAWYPHISINGKNLVNLSAGGYTYFFIKPGNYQIHAEQVISDIARTNKGETYNLDIEINDTGMYFVKFDFLQTGNKLNIAHTGTNPVIYASRKGSFYLGRVPRDKNTIKELQGTRYIAPNRKLIY